MKVTVASRVRPPCGHNASLANSNEASNTPIAVECYNDTSILLRDKLSSPLFNFDKVFSTNATQQTVFESLFVEDVDNFLKGNSGAVIMYGQTASGKSYTTMGYREGSNEHEGLIPRAIRHILDNSSRKLSMQYVEMYNDNLLDLLNGRSPVKLLSGGLLGNARSFVGASVQSYMTAIDKANSLRQTAATKMNSASSRSHAIVIFELIEDTMDGEDTKVLEKSPVTRVKLMVADLSGSETVKKSGVQGTQLKEAGHINTSLTSLVRTTTTLAEGKHTTCRDSKLTYLLKPALTESRSRTTFMVNISSQAEHLGETRRALEFGERAKKIKCPFTEQELQELMQKTAYTAKIEHALAEWKVKGPRPIKEWVHLGGDEPWFDASAADLKKEIIEKHAARIEELKAVVNELRQKSTSMKHISMQNQKQPTEKPVYVKYSEYSHLNLADLYFLLEEKKKKIKDAEAQTGITSSGKDCTNQPAMNPAVALHAEEIVASGPTENAAIPEQSIAEIPASFVETEIPANDLAVRSLTPQLLDALNDAPVDKASPVEQTNERTSSESATDSNSRVIEPIEPVVDPCYEHAGKSDEDRYSKPKELSVLSEVKYTNQITEFRIDQTEKSSIFGPVKRAIHEAYTSMHNESKKPHLDESI